MLKTLTDQPLRGNFTALQIEVLNYVAKNNVPKGTKFSGVPGHARYGSSSCTTLVVQNDDRTVEVNFSLNSNSSTPLPLCHPSSLRRIFFALYERSDAPTQGNYGSPICQEFDSETASNLVASQFPNYDYYNIDTIDSAK